MFHRTLGLREYKRVAKHPRRYVGQQRRGFDFRCTSRWRRLDDVTADAAKSLVTVPPSRAVVWHHSIWTDVARIPSICCRQPVLSSIVIISSTGLQRRQADRRGLQRVPPLRSTPRRLFRRRRQQRLARQACSPRQLFAHATRQPDISPTDLSMRFDWRRRRRWRRRKS